MKESVKQMYIVFVFLGLGFLFLLLGPQGLQYFIFWELTFAIGGTIAIYQQDKKEQMVKD